MKYFIALVAAIAMALTLEHFWKGAHGEAFKLGSGLQSFSVSWVLLAGLGLFIFFGYKLSKRGSR